jgi:hypothetical protein
MQRVPDRGHIAVYGDTWEDQLNLQQPWNKNLTIAAVPGQVPRFMGSVEVTGWVPHAAGVWKRTGWITNFDRTPISPDMCHPDRPYAAWPEQVWVGGKPLKQMPPGTQMQPGQFWYDIDNRVMFISKDPEEGVTIANKSLFLSGNMNNQTGVHPELNLCGVSIEEWAVESKAIGAVRVYGHSSRIVDCLFRGCSASGLFVQQGAGIEIDHCEFRECGQLGLHGYHLKDLHLSYSVVADNNLKDFWTQQVAGGVKVDTESDNFLVDHCYIVRNNGHGVWSDLGSEGVRYLYNVAKNNKASGLYVELGYNAKFLSNWLEGNPVGTLCSGTGDVEIAYNTYVNNTYHNRVQREPRPDEPGQVYTHPQVGYNSHSNLYVQTIPDANCAMLSYQSYGRSVTYSEADWHSDRNMVSRVPGTGRAAVLTTNTNNMVGIPTISDVFVLTGEEGTTIETIAPGTHSTDSIPLIGLPMTDEVQQLLGVTDAEADAPNIGWYGPEYVPDLAPEPEEPMTLAEQLHAIELDVEALDQAHVALISERDQLLVSISEKDLAIADLHDDVSDLEGTLAVRDNDLALATAHIAELDAQIVDLQAQLEDCDCPVGREQRLAPLRGYHRWGAVAKPGTLAALAAFDALVGSPAEARRIFSSGDTDWTVDTGVNRVPVVEVPLGTSSGDLDIIVNKAKLDNKPVVFTIGHEEERPDKNNTPAYFKSEVGRISPILRQADKAIVIVTYMNGTLRGFVKKDNVAVNIQDWLPVAEFIDGIGFDVYVGDAASTNNTVEKVCKPMLQIAYQLQVPLFVCEFAVAGTAAQRANWVTLYMQWVYGLHGQTVTYADMPNAHLLAPLLSIWFHSDIGGNPPTLFDGTKGWWIHKANDQADTQTKNVWLWGIASNGV